MTMRVKITNCEPGFSDARVAIQPKGGEKVVLTGGKAQTFIVEPGVDNQILLQALRRSGEEKK